MCQNNNHTTTQIVVPNSQFYSAATLQQNVTEMHVCTHVTEKEQTCVVDGLMSAALMLNDQVYIKNSISRELLWEEKHKMLLKKI